MKSPDVLAAQLARQWQNADLREQRLLDPSAWPLRVPIGRPSPAALAHATASVREHVEHWRRVRIGTVAWQDVRYRSAAEPVALPVAWCLASPAEWAAAAHNAEVKLECVRLQLLLPAVDPRLRQLLVRQRALWRDRSDDEVLRAAALALELEPGVAAGRPLRAIALAGIDSKFMERNRALVTALLDVRFDGAASTRGLETFLAAADEGEHWLLVAPLAPGLLPFTQQRVRARELQATALPARRLLLIENDRCLHLLPELPDTIAVLGSGLDLAWLDAPWLRDRDVAYWGDLDTWGLVMLARALSLVPHLQPLLMDQALFERHAARLAVAEPVPADAEPPSLLTAPEQAFYCYLRAQAKGRIEQEFLRREEVARACADWIHAVDTRA